MINYLKTKSEDLLKEFYLDLEKSRYWHKKNMGGDKKYEKLKQVLKEKAITTGKDQLANRVEWISKNGNRFVSQDIVRYFGQGETEHTTLVYSYWETIGSIGAFIPFQFQYLEGHQGILIFTNHFFLRYTDRLGIKERTKKEVLDFMSRNYCLSVYTDSEYQGKKEYIIQTSEGKCYGHPRKDNPSIIEVDTFLKDDMLTGKQRKEAKPLNEYVKEMGPAEPFEVTIRKTFKSRNYEDMQANLRKLYRGVGTMSGKTPSESNQLADVLQQISVYSTIFGITSMADADLIMKVSEQFLELAEKYLETGRFKEDTEVNPLDMDILLWKYSEILGKDFKRGSAMRRIIESMKAGYPGNQAVLDFERWMDGVQDWDGIWKEYDF